MLHTAGSGRAAIALAAAFVLCCAGTATVAAQQDDDLASRFTTAPQAAPNQRQLVEVEVNGVAFGLQVIRVSAGRIGLPAATVDALGIAGHRSEDLDLAPASGIVARLDEAQGTLFLKVPTSMLAAQHFAPASDTQQVRLSPETWGAYVNYSLNARHEFEASSAGGALTPRGGSSTRSSALGSWGGIAEMRVLAPDVIGSFGWAYDSSLEGAQGPERLDSTLVWRPSRFDIAASAGDIVSATISSLAQARPYRFGGLQVGTDHSGSPGWSSSPIPSVIGTAQAQSAIDVYLDGQRTFHTSTAGGAFSLILPPGSTGTGTSVVVTDVTGRSVVIPVEVARADAQLLRQGLFLWSAGLGSPRFAYGTSASRYDSRLYGYANARYGAFNALTATVHAEGGAGLAEAEGGADMAVAPWLAAHASAAASRSARGIGGAGRLSLSVAGPWTLGMEATAAHTVGAYDDVVSVSGRTYSHGRGFDPVFSLPATSELSGRLSWQPRRRLSLSASYQADTYRGSTPVGFASFGASYLVADSVPVFANLSHAMGGQRTTALVVGVTFALGGVQVSSSGGYGTGGQGGPAGQGGLTGGITAARTMGGSVGDIGWDVYANRAPGGTFANADAQVRTGYGVPGVTVQSFGPQVTTYATLQGSAGVVGLHPFLADPASGGIIIADAGRPGVPVQLNGYDKGRTSFDGKVALAGAVEGGPQRVAIDTARLPIDAVPSETDTLVTVRERGATVASFGVRSAAASALLNVTYRGAPPPVGSTMVSAAFSAPISKEGRAYLPSLARDEVLTVEMPDGEKCLVHTRFDGHGGVGRRIGTFNCEEAR